MDQCLYNIMKSVLNINTYIEYNFNCSLNLFPNKPSIKNFNKFTNIHNITNILITELFDK